MGAETINNGDSSSGEENEDPKWKAAIQSITATTAYAAAAAAVAVAVANGSLSKTKTRNPADTSDSIQHTEDNGDNYDCKPQKPKLYQIKAQKLLDELLEKNLETVRNPLYVKEDDEQKNVGGVRLFKHSSVGIVFDHVDEVIRPNKRPKILPGRVIDENSKEFRKRLKMVAVDGSNILASSKEALQKSLARLEAKEAAAKEKAKKEEERVAELKKIRGEKWLPSVAREMKRNGIPKGKA